MLLSEHGLIQAVYQVSRQNSFQYLSAIGYNIPYILWENITSIYALFKNEDVSQ